MLRDHQERAKGQEPHIHGDINGHLHKRSMRLVQEDASFAMPDTSDAEFHRRAHHLGQGTRQHRAGEMHRARPAGRQRHSGR